MTPQELLALYLRERRIADESAARAIRTGKPAYKDMYDAAIARAEDARRQLTALGFDVEENNAS